MTMREGHSPGIISLTRLGAQTARKINERLQGTHYPKQSFAEKGESAWEGPLKSWFQGQFQAHEAWILVMATGIAVRMIAPMLEDKYTDPAVVVIDEQGRYPISLLSGHIGGANDLTQAIAHHLGVEAIITTASDGQGVEAVDLFAGRNGLIMADREAVTRATARLVNGEPIAYWDPGDFLGGKVPKDRPEKGVPVVLIEHDPTEELDHGIICRLFPKNVVVGLGFRRQITGEMLYEALIDFLMGLGVDPRRVSSLASIDLKTKSAAFDECTRRFQEDFGTVDSQTIAIDQIAGLEANFETSTFVKRTVGVGAVAGPCGYLASKGGTQVGTTYRGKGMTFSCWIESTSK